MDDKNTLDPGIQDFIKRYTTKPNTLPDTDAPIDVQFNEDIHSIFAGTNQYPESTIGVGPSKLETIEGAFKDQNEIYNSRQFIQDKTQQNPFNDMPPQGWKPSDDPSVLQGVNPENQSYVLNGTSPQDVKNRQFEMIDRQLDLENWENGSTALKIFGGFTGNALNITSYAPIATGYRYSKLGEQVVMNAVKTIPSVAFSSVAHEGWLNTVKNGGNLEDFVVNSAIDTVTGTAFMAGGFGLSHAFTATKLWNARNVVKLRYDGIDVVPELNEEGHLIGAKAVINPQYGESINAMKVDFAQKFADAEFSKNGLFAIPYLSGFLTKTGKAYNPLFRGLTSKYEAVRGYTQRMGSSGFYTKGVESGETNPINFDDEMFKLQADSLAIQQQYKGYYAERVGIGLGFDTKTNPVSKAVQKTVAKWTKKDGYVSQAKFGEEVAQVQDTGTPSIHTPVNQAAQMLNDEYKEMYTTWRDAHGYSEEFLSPSTQKNYTARVMNHDALITRPDDWDDMVLKETKENEAIIRSLTKPIDDMKEEVKGHKDNHQRLVDSGLATDDQLKESSDRIKMSRNKLKQMKNSLQDKLRSDNTLRPMVDDILALSSKEATQLNKLLKPTKLLQKELDSKKSEIEALRFKAFTTEEAINASKTTDKASKHKKVHTKLTNDISVLEQDIKDIKNKLEDEDDKLQQQVQEGKVDRLLYERIPGSQRVKFKNPNKRLKFVKPFESDSDILKSAQATRNTYLNQTNEQTMDQVLGQLTGISSPNYVKNRTNMIKDETLRKNGFMSTDLPLILNNYRRALGRQVNLKKVFGDLSVDGGIEPIIERLNNQHQLENQKILDKKLAPEEQKKALREENKEYKKAVEFLNLSHNRAMGRSSLSNTQRKFNHFQSTLAAFLKLGMTVLTMSTDLTGIIFKHGFFPSIQHGLLPMLKTLISAKDRAHVREVATAAHLANSHLLGAMRDQNFSTATEQHIPIQGKIATGLEWAAHSAQNLNLITYAENLLQRWTATIIQHKIMKAAIDHMEGKLNPNDNKAMLLYGLDISKYAKRFIDGWKEKGSDGNGFGGYLSHYYEWSDTEASNIFADTVMRGTRDTIVRRGMMDAPFFTDNSLWGALYSTFKGWTFATGTRFLIPFLQNPTEGKKIIGIMFMLGAGATQSPLRKLASGQNLTDEDLDTNTLFYNGVYNSGVFSIPAELLQELNILTSGKLLKGIKNEKYRDRTIAGIAAGPAGGEAEDIRRIVMMLGSGNYNKSDIHRMIGLSGYGQSLWFRGLANKWLESTSLPKTAREAQ